MKKNYQLLNLIPIKKNYFYLYCCLTTHFLQAQAWKFFNILSGNHNATCNEIRLLNGTTGCPGSTIATTNGIPAGIVMDGRDIGTTVFPNAELKIFIIEKKA